MKIHAPLVSQIDLDKLIELADGTPLQRDVQLAVRFLQDPTLHCEFDSSVAPRSSIKLSQVHQLVQNGFAEEVPETAVRCWGLCSTIPEVSKQRLRVIHDMLPENVFCEAAPKIHLRSIRDLKALAQNNALAATFDFKCWYYQLPLSPEVQRFCGFRVGKRWFCLKVGPMGHKHLVFVAHTITRALAEDYADPTTHVETDVIIDNVSFWSNSVASLEARIKRFKERCAIVGAVIGQEGAANSTVTHRGMCFNLIDKTVALKPQWTEKFIVRVTRALNESVPAQCWQSLLGGITWINTVLEDGFPAAELFFTYKFIARIARLEPRSFVVPWDCVKVECSRLVSFLRSCPTTSVSTSLTSNETPLLVTDASKTGPFAAFGAMLVLPHQQIHTFQGIFDLHVAAESHINELELRALHAGLVHFSSMIAPGSTLRVALDNSCAVHILKSGRSSSSRLHPWVRAIKRLTRDSHITLCVAWIPSKANPADGLSRQRGLTADDLAQGGVLADLVGVVREETAFPFQDSFLAPASPYLVSPKTHPVVLGLDGK